ncbi:DUF2442 domain-containing protein [bacterium]|nr:DUF2442 domain-containing protein [bacterium]
MKLKLRGGNTSKVEVTNISNHGIWLWIDGEEYFLPYKDYPWFKGARGNDVSQVRILHDTHLHWPKLDVDLDVSALRDPGRYPLVYR